jgi:hypothetical protein
VRVFQAAQPPGECAAPDPDGAAGQPHHRRAGSLLAPAVKRGPGHPQLGDHLIDRQQRVARGSGVCGRGGGGLAGSGWRSRGRPVRGSATTHAPLRPARQVRPPPGRRRQAAARGGRPGDRGEEERPRRCGVRRGGAGRAARPCRRGRRSGAGAGWSRAVTDGTPSPLLGAVAAGPVAGRRGGLACRPGPQASTLPSGRPVKSPGAGPRAGTGRCPPRTEGAAPHEGRPPGGSRAGGTVARPATVPATVVHAPAAGQPGVGTPGRAQRVMLLEGSVIGWLVPPCRRFFRLTQKSGFEGHFSLAPGNWCWRGRARRSCRGPLKMSVRSPTCRCACRLCTLFVGDRAALPGPAGFAP